MGLIFGRKPKTPKPKKVENDATLFMLTEPGVKLTKSIGLTAHDDYQLFLSLAEGPKTVNMLADDLNMSIDAVKDRLSKHMGKSGLIYSNRGF